MSPPTSLSSSPTSPLFVHISACRRLDQLSDTRHRRLTQYFFPPNQVHREASTLVRREREGADALFQLGLATTLLGQNEVLGLL